MFLTLASSSVINNGSSTTTRSTGGQKSKSTGSGSGSKRGVGRVQQLEQDAVQGWMTRLSEANQGLQSASGVEEQLSAPSKKRKLVCRQSSKNPCKSKSQVSQTTTAKQRKLSMKTPVSDQNIVSVDPSPNIQPPCPQLQPPELIDLVLFFDLIFDLCITPALTASALATDPSLPNFNNPALAAAAIANSQRQNEIPLPSCLPTSSSLLIPIRIAFYKNQIMNRFHSLVLANPPSSTRESLISIFFQSAASLGLTIS